MPRCVKQFRRWLLYSFIVVGIVLLILTLASKKESKQERLAYDSTVLSGLMAVIQSIKVHNKQNNIVIHVVVSRKDKVLIRNTISCSIKPMKLMQITVTAFELSFNLFRSIQKSKSYLATESNFARFFIEKLFPSLSHVLYIDTDTLVLHDLSQLWTEVIHNDKLLLAVPRNYSNDHLKFRNIGSYFYANIGSYFYTKYGIKYRPSQYDFNAGVVGFNLNKWRANNVTEDVKYWMELNSKHSLWGLGTQPIMYLISYNNWNEMDKRWNVQVHGSTKKETFDSAYLVHFSGHHGSKPWLKKWKKKWNHVYNPFSIWFKYYKEVHVCSHDTGVAEGTVLQELSASVKN